MSDPTPGAPQVPGDPTAGTPRAEGARMLRLPFVLVTLLLASGCVPTLHFRAASATYEPIRPRCVRIERCDHPDPGTQARCEMAELSVPEAGALLECTEVEG